MATGIYQRCKDFSISADDMTLYTKNSTAASRNLLELIDKCSEVCVQEIHRNLLCSCTLIMKVWKEKLGKQSHLALQQK